jgi:hypothetical protein
MYLNMSTGNTLTQAEAREIEKRNQQLLNSGNLADLSKVQFIIRLG